MIDAVRTQILKAKNQIRQNFLGIVARGGSQKLQLKGFADEVLTEVELFQHIGVSSHIPEGAKVVVIPMQGKTSRSIVLGTTGGAIQIETNQGETCIYDQFGHTIWLKEDGIHIQGDVFVEGKIQATSDICDQTGTMQNIRDIYNQHTNGNTSTPTPQM